MAKEPTFTVYIHINDDVKMRGSLTPGGDDDFASVNIGNQASILLFNSDQAKALIDAVEDAFFVLKNIEAKKARVERARARDSFTTPVVREVDEVLEQLLAEEEEIEQRTRYAYDEPQCSISNPCQDCLEIEDRYEYDEPF